MELKQIGDQILQLSHLSSNHHPHPPECVSKPRRRRRRGKGEAAVAVGAGAKKRRLSEEQVRFLEMKFGDEHKLQPERKARLASEIGLEPRQVAVWFQNRRARWKNKKLEDECQRLRELYEGAVEEKCLVQAENLELRNKLAEVENEISKACSGDKSYSPTSSFTFSPNQPFPGVFEIQDETFMYENINIHSLEWLNFYPM